MPDVSLPSVGDQPRPLHRRGIGVVRRLVKTLGRRSTPVPATPESFQKRLHSQVRQARWEGSTLVLEGFAYLWGLSDDDVTITISAVQPGRPSVPFMVAMVDSSEVDTLVDDQHGSHRMAAFVARLDVASLRLRADSTWALEVAATHAPRELTARGPISYVYRWGSAGHIDALRLPRGFFATVRWDSGLHVDLTRPAVVLEEASTSDDSVVARVSARRGVRLRSARAGQSHDLALEGLGRRSYRVLLDRSCPAGRHELWVTGADGTDHRVWADTVRGSSPISLASVQLALDGQGPVVVEHRSARVVVTTVETEVRDDLPVLVVTGLQRGVEIDQLRLTGPRVDLRPIDLQVEGESFAAVFSLWVPRPWADRPSALMPGGYSLALPGDVVAQVSPDLLATLYRRVQVGRLRLRVECTPAGALHLNVTRPRSDEEIGRYNRKVLRAAYTASTPTPRDAVLFESFSGRSANDNTVPLSRELLARRPDLEAFWAVTDHSVVVPEGIEAVLRYSRRWWDLLAASRLIVTNSWLPGGFTRRPHQQVLQAWHGTPFKRMGLDRIGRSQELDEESKGAALVDQAAMWNILLAQNQFSEDVFRQAYRFEGDVVQSGYPRNDVLVGPDRADIAARTRARLGIGPTQQVVLYMPTWREDDKKIFAELDLAALADAIGPSGVVLVRGHSNTLTRGAKVAEGSVVDVTVYPEVSDLYLVADVLITDYSSAMFDFSVTGRPIVFFTPDIERYTTTLRGTYFDLAESAPGPLVSTTQDVIDALADIDHVHAQHADRYRAWQQRFNPHDDGQATARAIDALLR